MVVAFVIATSLISGDTYVTLPDVTPLYMTQLECIIASDSFQCIRTVGESLLAELNKRFGCLVDPKNNKHNPMYAIATMLHPSLKVYITSNDHMLKSTKEKLINLMKEDCGKESDKSMEEECESQPKLPECPCLVTLCSLMYIQLQHMPLMCCKFQHCLQL